ncbi:hypothetical protein [Streptacidiphilus neutrinimicus]|uniref:hypothetical protein n=1 Tax=Streptacidiphilus neutrinimicus TaxID=105420 RepID=UPI0007C6B4D1|nr:hypothetical protein [Streptacidiphilus neutrinimicus]
MSIGHPLELSREPHTSSPARSVDLTTWTEAGLPTLLDPRSVVGELHRIHLPHPGVTVLGVLTADGRVAAGASFVVPERITDGWHLRNVLLAHLRHVVPHGLRRRSPMHSAVVLQCRDTPSDWTELDGAWMWALRDASVLHGLRCGAYITLTENGWQVMGESRQGRSPQAGSWARRTMSTVRELPSREHLPALTAATESRPRAELLPAAPVAQLAVP